MDCGFGGFAIGSRFDPNCSESKIFFFNENGKWKWQKWKGEDYKRRDFADSLELYKFCPKLEPYRRTKALILDDSAKLWITFNDNFFYIQFQHFLHSHFLQHLCMGCKSWGAESPYPRIIGRVCCAVLLMVWIFCLCVVTLQQYRQVFGGY